MSSLNISKDGICWTSLHNLFQKCFASLAEGLFPSNIQSEFILLQLPISMIHLCMHTSLFWEKFFFLFSITPHKVQKTANRSLSAFELQAEQSCLSLCVCLCKSNIHVYISCTPVSYLRGHLRGTCLGGIPLEFPRFLTLKGTEQDAALQVQPHGFQAEGNYHFSLSHRLRSYQQNPISG